ncbi:uncharacterized protein LOC117300332 [Asterias rubens]|uniref:uncharacterized protein LOC117300332 n=1 Tax=Asterias rubens TaxID=7604 RepID=UPI0014553857|nr:uncharacterized protein LOC117300332 [Asterias rubens]
MALPDRILAMMDLFKCHLTWEELAPIANDKSTLSREEDILAMETLDFLDRPTFYTATRNLQGFIAYYLQKVEEARLFFEDVLDKDNNNINALASLAHIFKELYHLDLHSSYINRLSLVLDNLSLEERARAFAERSFAIRNFEQFKRCFRYMTYIERAATIGKKCAGPERAEWFFDHALALYRRDVQMLYLRRLHLEDGGCFDSSDCYSDTRIKEGFQNACRYFLDVALISPSKDYQALSWVFLGILVNHDPENRNLADVFPNKSGYHLTAEQCFEKSLEIHPDYCIVLRRVGAEYVKLGRFKDAKRALDKALEIMPSRCSYRYRAELFVKMYESSYEADEQVKREWLTAAVSDFEEALKMYESHADLSDLGYVLFLLGDNERALAKFRQATNSKQDDYCDPVLTHQRWAECLLAINQLKGSQLQLELAQETLTKILNTPLMEEQCDSHFTHDFEFYNTKEKPGFVRVLQDHHFWTVCTEPGFPAAANRDLAFTFDAFLCYAEQNKRWAMAFVEKLESEYNLRCCIEGRDFQVGKKITKNIIECLKQSYRCVILFPGDGGSMCHSMDHAEIISQKRKDGFIIPIKLKDCPKPEELEPLTFRECTEGQIKKEHWDEIVRLCRQTTG